MSEQEVSQRDDEPSPQTKDPPLLLRASEAAAFVGVSRSEFYRLDITGQVPRPVRFGKVKRWGREILRRWAALGFPPRDRFEEHS